jgi:xylan 1,4-beta-xylosidase
MTKLFLSITSMLSILFLQALVCSELAIAQTAEPTITVDFATRELGVHSMSGFLHAMTETKPADSLLRPLQPKLWRLRDLTFYDRIVGMGARVELMVSDTWGYPFQKWNPPYENYTKWENYIRKLAQDTKGKKIIWDIWNEPNGGIPPFWNGTREQLFRTYEQAYRVLREELGPTAMIGGPSVADYDRDYIIAFLEYCRKHGVEVNFLSWHELLEADEDIPSIANHLRDARRNMVNNPRYKNLNIREIHINEAIGPKNHYRPGDIVGYLYYLEKGRADAAVKACWTSFENSADCNNNLDGLIDPSSDQPRAAWWVYKLYADGFENRVSSSSTGPNVVALASKSTASKKSQILLGSFSPKKFLPTYSLINLKLNNLATTHSHKDIHWTLYKIPNKYKEAVNQLIPIKEGTAIVRNGQTQIKIPTIKPHEACLVILEAA